MENIARFLKKPGGHGYWRKRRTYPPKRERMETLVSG